MTPEATRSRHIQLIQAGRSARAERLDPAALARYELRQMSVTGTLTGNDRAGWVGDCYHARWHYKDGPSHRVILGDDPLARVKNYAALRFGTAAKFPSQLAGESDEERPVYDCDDEWLITAHRRYTGLMERAAQIKKRNAANTEDRLARLRAQWREVEWETGVSWEDVEDLEVVTGEQAQLRVNREAAEVKYCHRDPSDWQILTEDGTPDSVIQALVDYEDRQRVAETLDVDVEDLDGYCIIDLEVEEAEDVKYDALCIDRRKRIDVAWRKLFAELGEDADHGRIVTRWLKHDGRYIKPVATIGKDEFVARKIHDKGDELDGLNTTLASLRFRLNKKRERAERKAA